LSSIFPLGAMLGPALGGLIVTYSSWRLIFYINVPVGFLLILVLSLVVPKGPPSAVKTRIDLLGSALMALTILMLMLGVNELGLTGWGSPLVWAPVALSVALGAGFLVRQGRSLHPIIPPVLLRQRAFAVVNALNVLYGAAAFGVFSLVPLYAQVVFGMSPLKAGSLLTVRAAAMAVFSALTSILVLRRFGYRKPMFVGSVALAMGLILISIVPPMVSVFAWLNAGCVICGLGIGFTGPPSNNAALELMPSQVAAITGLRSMFRQTGGILAVSITAAIITGSAQGPRVLPAVFTALGIVTLVACPLILGVPERSLGASGLSRATVRT
jgi:MFS family permease